MHFQKEMCCLTPYFSFCCACFRKLLPPQLFSQEANSADTLRSLSSSSVVLVRGTGTPPAPPPPEEQGE